MFASRADLKVGLYVLYSRADLKVGLYVQNLRP
jgi:hypothetical protein